MLPVRRGYQRSLSAFEEDNMNHQNKQNKYLLIALAFLGLAFLAIETITPLSFVALGGMLWAIFKGELWEAEDNG